ncbi:MAG: hypothetical protein HUJ29_06845 [Gammaproteobacteria bacterium]|nr:hypothetical protein [Gammaproteobacteria bacterium]
MSYHIDADDIIIYAEEAPWNEFAKKNGAADLTVSSILNKSLYGFITGHTTRHLTQLLISQARASAKAIQLPFRCDSPTARRHMQMHISPGGGTAGDIEITTCLIREEPRERLEILDASIDHSEAMLNFCSWCNKVEVHRGEWMELEDAVRALHLMENPLPPELTHGMCPSCLEEALKVVRT